MKNYKQPGDTLTLAAPSGGVVSGTPYMIGSIFGVAAASAAQGDDFALVTEGVFELPKTSALAISVGDKLYWDNANGVVNKTNTNPLVGVAVTAAANPSATVEVKLDGAIR